MRRFIPYVQMHEFEGLLFSDPSQLAAALGEQDLAKNSRRFGMTSKRPNT